MLFAVQFIDHQHDPSIRRDNLAAHIRWLDENCETVLVAGSLRAEPSANPVGGLWIVDAPSKQAVIDLIATDPFWIAGLRAKVEIFHWMKAFEDRKVAV